MRFRPANISLINRRHYLPRLLLILSSKRQMQKPPQRFEDVDRVTPYQGIKTGLRLQPCSRCGKSKRQASLNKGIDNVHTCLREIDAVLHSDRETVDNCLVDPHSELGLLLHRSLRFGFGTVSQ
jgi:hypothetical protein